MRKIATLTVLTLVLGGCSMLESKKIDYKSAGTLPTLDAPPDLVMPSSDNHYALPNAQGSGPTSFSAYSQERAVQPAAANSAILPQVDKARVERDGSERWLVVDVPPKDVWPVVKDFWQGLGFIINVEKPDAGVMETDWAENRAKIPQDAIRNLLGKVLDSVYSTDERDKFRTRLEPTPDGKGTEIYISHRGMYEVFEGTQGGGDKGDGRTIWQPRAPDPGLEAEMLRRLMVRFGVEESKAKTMLADAAVTPQASLVKTANGAPGLALPEPFDRAWRRVGLALDRVGFLVEDRDRATGAYYVRYADPDAQTSKEKEGFLSKLAFWRSKDDKLKAEKYRVNVIGKGDSTEVGVYLENGSPAANETGNRIAKLLYEQLK
ncbi:MAG: outer membrane protein assembly factor BamC [Parasulfuritortus sp.]|jgi:outer membrane protein assembly factor BamC|nr:outer membrane protein assembly factor BamC [Parasulfuritortus sp.]